MMTNQIKQSPSRQDGAACVIDAVEVIVQHNKQMYGILQNMIDDAVDQPDVYGKVERFARYWNDEVATSGGGRKNRAADPAASTRRHGRA